MILTIQFGLYLLLMLGIGSYAMRRTQNNEDFIIGNRTLGPVTTAISTGASDMSSWLLLGLPGAVFAAENYYMCSGTNSGEKVSPSIIAYQPGSTIPSPAHQDHIFHAHGCFGVVQQPFPRSEAEQYNGCRFR